MFTEVEAHAERALHRRVVRDQLEEDEPRADERLGEHERHRCRGGAPRAMTRTKRGQRPHEEGHRQEERDAARHPVRQLDERLDPRRPRKHLAVARGPVLPATRAGAARPHVRAPRDDEHVAGQDAPGESREGTHRFRPGM